MGDLPDYTRIITVLLKAEILSQVRQLPWWVRYSPSRVLYLDDMEGVLKWRSESGAVVKESIANAFEQSNCITIETPAGAGATNDAFIQIGGVPRSKMRLQFRWNVYNADVESLRHFTTYLQLSDGANVTQFGIRYVHYVSAAKQAKWQYLDETASWADITDADEEIKIDLIVHQFLMLVADFADTGEYKSLVTSKHDLDLSGLKPYHSASADPPLVMMWFEVETDKAVAVKAAMDAVLLSDEEP